MSRSPRLDDLLPYLMNRLVSRLNQNLSERLRQRGYTFQDWRVLAVLAAHDGITLSQLAEATVIPQPTVSRLVARLERRGLLKRRVHTGDSRFIEARITPRGQAAYRRILPLAVDEYRGAVVGFDKAEAEWLRRATLRMIGNIGVELLKEVPAPGERKGNSKKRHSGTTAVASISSRAAARPAGRPGPAPSPENSGPSPRDRPRRARAGSARYSSMSITYQVSRTTCSGPAPPSASTAAMFSSACRTCATKPSAKLLHGCPSRSCRRRTRISPRALMPLA